MKLLIGTVIAVAFGGLVLGFWIVLQLLNGLGSFGSSGGVAFFAHIGGFLVGMGLLYVLKPRARSRAG